MVSLSDSYYMNITWPVYECYDDTIAYLKANDLWNGGFIEFGEIRKIDVTESIMDEDGMYTGETKEYTDSSEIEAIMKASLPMDYNSAWIRYGDLDYERYSITVYAKQGVLDDQGYDPEFYRTFYKDRIPGFVTGQ